MTTASATVAVLRTSGLVANSTALSCETVSFGTSGASVVVGVSVVVVGKTVVVVVDGATDV